MQKIVQDWVLFGAFGLAFVMGLASFMAGVSFYHIIVRTLVGTSAFLIVGGVIGGEVGGEKGGVLGGKLGGTVGGTGSGTEGNGKGEDKAPDPDAGPLRVGGDVKAPVVTERVNPNYSEPARAARSAATRASSPTRSRRATSCTSSTRAG